MPRCVAIDCNNASENGIKVCYFPNDERKFVWARNAGRQDDWIPKRNSVLCEVSEFLSIITIKGVQPSSK